MAARGLGSGVAGTWGMQPWEQEWQGEWGTELGWWSDSEEAAAGP